MSESASFSIRASVRLSRQPSTVQQLCAAVARLVGEAGRLPSSAQLARALAVVQPPSTVATVSPAVASSAAAVCARAGGLAEVAAGLDPAVAAVVDVQAPGLRGVADAAAHTAANLAAGGDLTGAARVLATAEAQVVEARRGSVAVLATAERVAVADVAVGALRAIGFQDLEVAASASAGITAIHAEQGDRTIGLLVRDGGAVELDVAGCQEGSCERVVGRFLEAVAHHGGQVSGYARTDRHRDQDGGSLIRGAGAHRRRNRTSWAEALLAVGGPTGAGRTGGGQPAGSGTASSETASTRIIPSQREPLRGRAR